MTTKNLALLTEAALTVPKKGPTTSPKRLTSKTRPKLFAFIGVVPSRPTRELLDAERPRLRTRPTFDSHSVFAYAWGGDWPTDVLENTLWAALSELWVRGDVRRRTWPWEEDPLGLLVQINPQFWHDTLTDLDVENLMWPLTGSGPYPRAKLRKALDEALSTAGVAA